MGCHIAIGSLASAIATTSRPAWRPVLVGGCFGAWGLLPFLLLRPAATLATACAATRSVSARATLLLGRAGPLLIILTLV